MARTILSVPDISCEHCEHTITSALTPVEGIQSVRVDIGAKQVSVDYDASRVDVERMQQILNQEDYPVASAAPG
jgi:copper chaperone